LSGTARRSRTRCMRSCTPTSSPLSACRFVRPSRPSLACGAGHAR
jgi:hypothetical protein